jgi:hypothetical protein
MAISIFIDILPIAISIFVEFLCFLSAEHFRIKLGNPKALIEEPCQNYQVIPPCTNIL